MSFSDFHGILPALLTAFDRNERYDDRRQKEILDFLLDEMHVPGLYVAGGTGQGVLMETGERKKAVEGICRHVAGRVPVVVHVGAIATGQAVQLARQAGEAGADGLSAVPPFYFGYPFEQILEYYRAIAESVALPVVIYNIPSSTGVNFGVEQVRAAAQIPNVRGIKYTASNHYEMGRIKRHMGEDFMVYSGADEMMLSGFLMGVDGAIGSTYNVIPELYGQALASLRSGDMPAASETILQCNDILEIWFRFGLMPAMRACLRFMGVDAGYDPRPFKPLDKAAEEELKKQLKAHFEKKPAECRLCEALS